MDNFAFLNLGTPELLLVVLIILLLFGGSKLPELARSFGSSVSELRKSLTGDTGSPKQTSKAPSDSTTQAS